MVRIGVVGASGFVGNRAIELLHEDAVDVRAIGRSTTSFDRLTLKNLDCRVANAFDSSQLETAFRGCDVVVHSILGSPGLIRGSIAPTYRAAQNAGVRRILYLSSMIVHRPAPAPGTTESSPLVEHQPYPAHPAKIDAERNLLQLRHKGSVEVVIFRPGIVFGPRSRWVSDLAAQLTQGTAYLIGSGNGICNTVYIDNLIHAMRLAMTTPAADGEAFFVGDREHVTWFDFYRPFAESFGIDPAQIPQLEAPEFAQRWQHRLQHSVLDSEIMQKALALMSNDLKQTLKKVLPNRSRLAEPASDLVERRPAVTQMMAELQQSRYKLPFTKAEQILGYEPIVTFEEGCQHSIAWLAARDQLTARKPIVAS